MLIQITSLLGLLFGAFVAHSLLYTVQKYLKRKPLGMQSIIDLLILDLIKVRRLQGSLALFFFATYICDFKIELFYAKVICILTNNLICLVFAMAQVILLVKAVLIFQPGTVFVKGIFCLKYRY